MQYLSFWRRLAALIIILAPMIFAASAARADTGALGWWVKSDGTGAILIAPCGVSLCGQVAWMKTPLNEQGLPKTDNENPNAALRARRLCGLVMMGGMVPDGASGWHGGWIYDPKTGNTYKSIMHVAADGTLHLRGYIGIPLFGRSEIMTRPAQPLQPCAPG